MPPTISCTISAPEQGASMKPTIHHATPEQEFPTLERCHITEVSNNADDPELSIALARVEVGVTTAWHQLRGTTERYAIISGSGLLEIGNLPPRRVTCGDVVIIPPLCRQRITNTGEEDLLFYAICTPRFHNASYQALEE